VTGGARQPADLPVCPARLPRFAIKTENYKYRQLTASKSRSPGQHYRSPVAKTGYDGAEPRDELCRRRSADLAGVATFWAAYRRPWQSPGYPHRPWQPPGYPRRPWQRPAVARPLWTGRCRYGCVTSPTVRSYISRP